MSKLIFSKFNIEWKVRKKLNLLLGLVLFITYKTKCLNLPFIITPFIIIIPFLSKEMGNAFSKKDQTVLQQANTKIQDE